MTEALQPPRHQLLRAVFWGTLILMPWMVLVALLLRFASVPREPGATQDRWLARTSGLALYGFGFGIALPFVLNDLTVFFYGGPLAVVTATLLVSAIRTYFRDCGKVRPFVGDALLCLLVSHLVMAVSVGIVLPGLIRSPMAANEASATSTLRTLQTAQLEYLDKYRSGFSQNLKQLGPPDSGPPTKERAGLVDGVMAGLGRGGPSTSFIKNGYAFSYQVGETGQSYTISARPTKYGKSGMRSFLTDQTGVIRATPENRPATAHDLPI